MTDKSCQKLCRGRKILPHLGAAVGVLEIVETIHGGSCNHLLICFRKLLCDPVHTADKRHDPELVPDPDPSVCSPVPAEGLSCDFRKLINLVIIVILSILRQFRLRIVCMNPASCGNVCAGTGNDTAVLDDGLACCDIRQCNLVPPRNILAKKNDRKVSCCDRIALLQILQCDRNIIKRMNMDIFHMFPFLNEKLPAGNQCLNIDICTAENHPWEKISLNQDDFCG